MECSLAVSHILEFLKQMDNWLLNVQIKMELQQVLSVQMDRTKLKLQPQKQNKKIQLFQPSWWIHFRTYPKTRPFVVKN